MTKPLSERIPDILKHGYGAEAMIAEVRALEAKLAEAEQARDAFKAAMDERDSPVVDALDEIWKLFGYAESWEYPGQVVVHARQGLMDIRKFDAMKSTLTAERESAERLREALRSYGQHPRSCGGWRRIEDAVSYEVTMLFEADNCNCGLSAALAATGGKEPSDGK